MPSRKTGGNGQEGKEKRKKEKEERTVVKGGITEGVFGGGGLSPLLNRRVVVPNPQGGDSLPGKGERTRIRGDFR